jgi:opacity protein-like surface antigen
MKSILSLVWMVFMVQFGAVAQAETPLIQATSSYQGSLSRIESDYLIGQGWDAGQPGSFLWGDSEIQAMPDGNDPVLYLTSAFGVIVLPAIFDDEKEEDAWTKMIAGKLSKPGNFSPFIAFGAGVMPADVDAKISTIEPSVRFSTSLSESDSDKACGKLGVGVDFFPTKNVSFGLEGSYVFSLGDLSFDLGFLGDREMDILYFIFTLGAAYHF